jgi:hypothetical protein
LRVKEQKDGLPQLCALAQSAARDDGPHARDARAALSVARHAQHPPTYADFEVLAGKCGLQVTAGFGLQAGQVVLRWPNLRASVAVFNFE